MSRSLNTPQGWAEEIAKDISTMPNSQELALAYAYMALEDVNYHTENRAMIQKFGEFDDRADYIISGVYYDTTPGSSYDWEPDVALELAIIVAEPNHPELASWLKNI